MKLGIKRSLCVAGCLSVLVLPTATAADVSCSNILNKGIITGAAIKIGNDTYPVDPSDISYTNNSDIDLSAGENSQVLVDTGFTLTNNGALTNIGGFENHGTITTTNNGGTLSIVSGTNGNYGTITQSSMNISAQFTNRQNGSITAEVTNSVGANFTNEENASVTGSVINKATFANNGTVNGAISNEVGGAFTNTGVIGLESSKVNITNSGTFNANSGTLNVDKITNNAGIFTNKVASTFGTIDNKNGATYNNDAATTVTTLTNAGKINNNYSLNVTNSFNNTSNGEISGRNGTLDIRNGGTNDGTISQKDVKIAGDFANNNSLTATTNFENTGTITGNNGNLTVKDGSSTGSITQNNVSVNGTFTNSNSITAVTKLLNGGEFTNDATGSITAATIENSVGKTFTNDGAAAAAVTNRGRFNNNGTVTGTVSNVSGATFTNTGTIGSASSKANIINSGTFNANSGTLNVDKITNNAGTFTNKVASTLGSIDNKNGATYNNEAATTVTAVTNAGIFNNKADLTATTVANTNTFTNTSNLTADNLTNEKTFNNNGGTVTVNTSFENTSNGTISGGTLNLENGGTNSGTISNGTLNINGGTLDNKGAVSGATVKVDGNLTNNGSITNSNTTVNNGAKLTNSANKTISGGSIVANGTLDNKGKITGSTITVSGTDSVNSGTIENSTTNVDSSFTNSGTISGGTTNVNGTLINSGTMNGTGSVNVSGTLNNNGKIEGALALTINNAAKVEVGNGASINTTGKITIADGGALNINNGGSATLKANDDWSGSITNTDGTLNLSGRNDSGKDYTQSGGILNLTDSTFELANGSSISGGIVNVNGGSFSLADGSEMTGGKVNVTTGTVNVSGTIEDGAELSITNGVTYDVKSTGDVVLNNNDTWNGTGTVKLSGGNLDFQGTKDGANGVLKADSGELKINGALALGNGSYIKDAVNAEINKDVTLNSGSSVSLNTGDSWNAGADITVSGGTLNYTDLTSNGALHANSGNVNISGGELTIASGSTIASAVNTQLTGGKLIVDGGSVALNGQDKWSGDVELSSGSLDFNMANTNTGKLNATGGNLNVNGGTLTLVNGSSVKDTVATTINGNVDVQAGADLNLNSGDSWSSAGKVTLNGGTLNYSDLTSNGVIDAKTGDLNINSGTLNVGNNSSIESAVNTTVTGDMNISGSGKVVLDGSDKWTGDITMSGGSLDYSLDSNGKLVASGGNLTVRGGTLTLATDSSVGNAVKTAIKSDVVVNGGELNLNSGDSWTSGTITMDDGTFNYSDITSSGKLVASDGTFNFNSGSLTLVDGSSIAAEVDTKIAGTLNLNDGSVILEDSEKDSWTGVVNLNGGSLDYALNKNGALHASKGDLTVSGGKLTLNNGSYVNNDVKTVINSAVDVKGGTLSLNSGDTWTESSKVTLDGGTFNYADLIANGLFAGVKGNLNTKEGSVLTVSGAESFIKSEVTANINGDLVIANGGVVDLGNTGHSTVGAVDKITGNVLVDNGGTLNIFNDLNFRPVNPDTGYSDQVITINSDGKMNLETTGELHLYPNLAGAGPVDKNGEGNVWFHGNFDNYTGNITIKNGGDLLFEQGLTGSLVIGEDVDGKGLTIGIHADEIKGNLIQERDITMKYSTYHDDIDLNLAMNPDSVVNVTKGAIIAQSKGDNNINFGGTITVSPAEGYEKPVSMTAISNGSVNFNNNVNINDATMNLTTGKGANFNKTTVLSGDSHLNVIKGDLNFDKLTFIGTDAVIHDMNGQINSNTIGDLDLYNGKADFTVDLNGRDWQHDKFVISDITDLDGGNIHISDWQFADDWNRTNKAPIDRHIIMNMFDVSKVDPAIAANINFTQTDKEIFTPIGWYKLENYTKYNNITGVMESVPGVIQSSLVRYNPQVFRGQVATLAMHNNQLIIDDMLTNHVGLHSERFLDSKANKYAIHEGNYVGPYQYTQEDGGIWMKNFVSFEKLSMTQNLRVGNNFYGTLVGADLPVVDLKQGWKLVPTAYIGYNGAHQYFSNVSMYQNGGQLGFMGTFLKDNFVGSVLAYAGAYLNDMKVNGINEYTENFFVGTAAKAAYNYHPTKHFTIQPNVFVSYNFFGKQNWHSNFGDMCMNSGYMNGVNVAPGLNLIYARETWSTYATFQYMYNINDDLTGRAGNVMLDGVQMRHGYIQYGIGVTKTWKDRMNSFFQIVLRNGGRTGIGFQLGAQYLFDWKTPWSKKPQAAPKHEIKL